MVQLCADKGEEEDFIEMAAAKSVQYRQKQIRQGYSMPVADPGLA